MKVEEGFPLFTIVLFLALYLLIDSTVIPTTKSSKVKRGEDLKHKMVTTVSPLGETVVLRYFKISYYILCF